MSSERKRKREERGARQRRRRRRETEGPLSHAACSRLRARPQLLLLLLFSVALTSPSFTFLWRPSSRPSINRQHAPPATGPSVTTDSITVEWWPKKTLFVVKRQALRLSRFTLGPPFHRSTNREKNAIYKHSRIDRSERLHRSNDRPGIRYLSMASCR